MVRFPFTDPEGNVSFNLSWNFLVDLFIDCFLHVLAVVYFDFYAITSSFPFFVFTVFKTFWFGVIMTNPLLLTFVFINFVTFSYVIRIGDLYFFAFCLINIFADVYVNNFLNRFHNFFISKLFDRPPFNLATWVRSRQWPM